MRTFLLVLGAIFGLGWAAWTSWAAPSMQLTMRQPTQEMIDLFVTRIPGEARYLSVHGCAAIWRDDNTIICDGTYERESNQQLDRQSRVHVSWRRFPATTAIFTATAFDANSRPMATAITTAMLQ